MVALLRAVNLGPRNRVPMTELRQLLGELGHAEAVTVGQSGNVVLSTGVDAPRLAREVQAAIAGRFGVDTPVIVRTADDWERVVAGNPLPVPDGRRFQVVFFAEPPSAAAIEDAGEERVAVRGREIYCWHPDGIKQSALAKALARLEGEATARNWNTVLRLRELL